MEESSPNVVIVSNVSLYNMMVEVRDLARDTKVAVDSLVEDSKDHEVRIRTVESALPEKLSERIRLLEAGDPRIPSIQQRVWIMSGAAGVVGTLVGYFLPRLLG